MTKKNNKTMRELASEVFEKGKDENELPYYISVKDQIQMRFLHENARDGVAEDLKTKIIRKICGL